jgi:hypothetical protein
MAPKAMGQLACALMLALGLSAHGQSVGSRAPETATNDAEYQPASPESGGQEGASAPSDATSITFDSRLFDRIWSSLSQQEDPDGPISTDRPTFTPANTVVPRGRFQIESGFTFNSEQTSTTRTQIYSFPELSTRYGLTNFLELRTLWTGQTYTQTEPRFGGRATQLNGPNDMEVGFKWQLFAGDKDRKWIPTTALITSIIVPTGGTSPFSSGTVEPDINLIYGWGLTDKLTLAGSTGTVGLRHRAAPRTRGKDDTLQQYHQSLVAFYSVGERTTLFYEWYVLLMTNAADNRPNHFMDGGLLYRLTPNMQLDIRAGFGLSGRPDDLFTGAGFSVRF